MKKILAIDDKKDNLIIIKAALKLYLPEYELLQATDGLGGLDLVQKEKPEVILLDVHMPGMDGYEVCKKLKSEKETENIPVIFLTAMRTDTESRIKGLDIGAEAFLTKPIDTEELVANIRTMLRIKKKEDDLRLEKEKLDQAVKKKSSELKFQTGVLENVSDAIITSDQNFIITSWNKASEKIYGYSSEEAIGEVFTELIKPEYISKTREEVVHELQKTGSFSDMLIHHKKNGESLYMQISVSTILDANKKAIGYLSINRDITEKQKSRIELEQTLKKLHENQERFNQVLEATNDGIWDWNLKTNEIYFSPNWKKMLGYEDNELQNDLSVWEMLTKDDYVEKAWIMQKDHIEGKLDRFELEFPMKHKDGHWVQILSRANAFRDEKGEAIRMIGSHIDITRQREAEDALRYEKQIAQQYLDIANVMMLSLNKAGEVVLINPKGCEILEGTENEIIGKNWFDTFIHAKDRSEIKSIFRGIIKKETKPIEKYNNWITTLKGNKRLISWSNSTLMDKEGNFTGLFSSGEDITEQDKALNDLRLSEKKHRALYENAPLAYQSLNDEGCFIDINPHWLKILGYQREEILGKYFPELLSDDQKSIFKTKFNELRKEGSIKNVHYKLKHKKGHFVDVLFEGCVGYNRDGSFKQTFCVFQDITDFKNAREKEKQLSERIKIGMHAGNLAWWEMDIDTGEVIFDDRKAELLEYSPSKFKHFTDFTNLIHPDDHDQVMQAMREHLTGGTETYEAEYRTKTKSGKYLWFRDIGKLSESIDSSGSLKIIGIVEDITLRKETAEELRKNESLLEKIFEESPIGLWIADKNGKLIKGNSASKKIWGMKTLVGPEEYGIFKARFLPSRKEIKPADWAIHKTLSKGITIGDELIEIDTFDGKKKIVLNYTSPIFNDEGEIDGAIIVNTDISQRARAENERLESEKKFRTIIESTPDAIFIANQEKRHIYVNDVACKLLEYSFEELTSMRINEVVSPDHIYHEPSLFDRTIQNGRSRGNVILQSKSGKHIMVDHSTSLLPDGNILAISRDITEQVEAQNQLRMSEEKYKVLSENMGECIWVMDLESNFIYINQNSINIYGLPADQMLKKRMSDFCDRKNWDIIHKEIKAAMEAWPNFDKTVFEVEFTRIDGSKVPVEITGTVISDKDGNIHQLQGLSRDITERKRKDDMIQKLNENLENKVKQRTAELEKANQAKSIFLANMSHEIRTPMNGVLGFADLLAEQEVNDTSKNYINYIRSSGKTLLTIIDDILDLSKLEAGKLKLNMKAVDLRSISKELKEIFYLKTREKNLDLKIEIANNLPSFIRIDENRLRQIIMNLMSNAIKFTDQGYVKLIAYAQNKKAIKKNGVLVEVVDMIIEVEDTGIGIGLDFQKDLFKPFTQQKFSATQKVKGTGLGLSITKLLAELMNGRISVKSSEGIGSTFKIYFHDLIIDSNEFRKLKKQSYDIENTNFNNAKVLIVDDVESNRKLLRYSLEQLNLQLSEADSGLTALKEIEKAIPDIILTDLMMPEMSGFDLITELRNNEKTKNIPIVAVSASGMKETQDVVKKYDFDAFIVKPYEIKELIGTLKKFLHK